MIRYGDEDGVGYLNPLGSRIEFNFSSSLNIDRTTSKYMRVGDGDGEGKNRPHPVGNFCFRDGLDMWWYIYIIRTLIWFVVHSNVLIGTLFFW